MVYIYVCMYVCSCVRMYVHCTYMYVCTCSFFYAFNNEQHANEQDRKVATDYLFNNLREQGDSNKTTFNRHV